MMYVAVLVSILVVVSAIYYSNRNVRVDNVKWVAMHNNNLNRLDVASTVEYVLKNHPNGGLVTLPMPSLRSIHLERATSASFLSTLADAVTVACFEMLGNDIPDSLSLSRAQSLEKQINITAMGNLAFISLHHSNEQVRFKATQLLNVLLGYYLEETSSQNDKINYLM